MLIKFVRIQEMKILGIETSCDETAAAVLSFDKAQDREGKNDRVQILSNVVSSSATLQAKFGGIIPEQAAREQIKSMIPVLKEALIQAFPDVIPAKAGIQLKNSLWIPDQVRDEMVGKIDAIAVTQGPGLIGSLLVGVETAKTLSLVWNKPLVPLNHLLAHFYAHWIEPATKPPAFPVIGLLVSGGHTDLILMTGHGKYHYLGGTRDDAAGEAFDKTARLLGLPYPGGPHLSKLAESGNKARFPLPTPMTESEDYDFSFSGLKTAVSTLLTKQPDILTDRQKQADLAASVEWAIVDSLVKKTVKAAKNYPVEQIMISGGVAANKKLRETLKKEFTGQLFIPPIELCTDNAAVIAAAAFYNFHPVDPLNVGANPNLSLVRA